MVAFGSRVDGRDIWSSIWAVHPFTRLNRCRDLRSLRQAEAAYRAQCQAESCVDTYDLWTPEDSCASVRHQAARAEDAEEGFRN